MPHHPDDQRYQHLPLIAEDPNPPRRRHPSPPPTPPSRGSRRQFSGELRRAVQEIEQRGSQRPVPAGIQPHLVFRVPLAQRASPQSIAEMLERLGLQTVSIEPDNAIVAFREEADLAAFRDAIDQYEQGPRINPATGEPYASTRWDVLEYIEPHQMRRWDRQDRIGSRLAREIGEQGQSINESHRYVLDVELWHRGTSELAQESLAEVRTLIELDQTPEERLSDSFAGDLLCLARVAVLGGKLDSLLELDVVAEADLPPVPVFDARMARQSTSRDFPAPPPPPEDGPRVCVVDSGLASNHPLLSAHVGHTEAVLTAATSPADEHGHGTMVGGIAVFGHVRACYQQGHFPSPLTLFSARVLNADNCFDDEQLIIHQMRRAIELFMAPPHNCRVFNLSLGDEHPWLRDNGRQSMWAESLDILAREFNVLLVISAGNQDVGQARWTAESEQIVATYPDYLFEPDCGLCRPATAAIPITVGGIADADTPSVPTPARENDLIMAVASSGQPTPTTRVGPGLNGAIKPEFVAPAGNLAFQGFSGSRQVQSDPGIAVMSFSHQPTERLFAFDVGTSFAAPHVARLSALLWASLEDRLEEEPQANLVRAVLASAALPPEPLHECISPEHGEEGVRHVCGYGVIDAHLPLPDLWRVHVSVLSDAHNAASLRCKCPLRNCLPRCWLPGQRPRPVGKGQRSTLCRLSATTFGRF